MLCIDFAWKDIFIYRETLSPTLRETIYRSTFVLLPGNWKVFIDIIARTKRSLSLLSHARRFHEILLHAGSDISFSRQRARPDVFTSGPTILYTAKLLSNELHVRRFSSFLRLLKPTRVAFCLLCELLIYLQFVYLTITGTKRELWKLIIDKIRKCWLLLNYLPIRVELF